MTDDATPRRPRRSPTGDPALDPILDELARADSELEERVLERRIVHRGRYMTFEQDVVERPEGGTTTRDLVVHPGAVAMLALDAEDRLLLVRQYRLAAGGAMLEIPAGTLDRTAGGIEDPEHAAYRELEEETGYRASHMERLGGFWTAPGFSSEYLTLFLAGGLRDADGDDRRTPDEDERLELVRLSLPDALEAIERGVIEDAKSVAAILWLARRLAAETPAARLEATD